MKEVYNSPEQIKVQELKNILDDNGIDCIVVEKNSPYVDASGNLTTYSVSVNDEDFDKANELFAAFKNRIKNSEVMPWCDKCGSDNVTKEVIYHKRSSIWFLINALFLFVLFVLCPARDLTLEASRWAMLFFGILFIVQYFRGNKEEVFTCHSCHNRFHRH